MLFDVSGRGWVGIGEYMTLPALSLGGVMAEGAGSDTGQNVRFPDIAGGVRGIGENER